ncbi:DUF300-domain-containing protein [Serendipita vermifera]|nr:DUF300-domain-containing protein [Serendipita vermifera]
MAPPDHGSGSGSALNPIILWTAGISALAATLLASMSIWLQLKNYRRPILQRQVVRIMLMIPIYAISSFISLFSLEAAVVIDAIRDIYEAFVIYNFFHLLVDYLGGERSLIILLHGRPPKYHVFPVSLFKSEIDVSDPFTFLWLKRGILQYVQVKPVLALVTLILKFTDSYKEGDLRGDAGYLYVSIIYNISICVALYCLAVFWIVINDDVKPYRPMPKFLCIKGILFFCFWQSFTISFLVSPLHLIKHLGPYTDVEHISIAISDVLICYEMPFFAVAHMFAFSHKDYIDPLVHYAARMRFWYAVRDAFGLLDVVEDSRATLHSTVTYKTYEPVEGGLHVGAGRERRIRAGLRYTKGGTQKYWLPMPADDEAVVPAATGPLSSIQRRWNEYQGYAPLPAEVAEDVVHEGFREPDPNAPTSPTDAFEPNCEATDEDDLDLHFQPPQEDREMEATYEESRRLLFGDYNYPVIDVSTEAARIQMWDEEERILSNARSAAWTWKGGHQGTVAYNRGAKNYGATEEGPRASTSYSNGKQRQDGPKVKASPHPAVIDFENETVPDIDVKGIRLKWTKAGAPVPTKSPEAPGNPRRSSSRSQSNVVKVGSTPGVGKSSSEEPQPEHVSDPDASDKETVDERDDAVDLVVEDKHAGELEMEWERRRGEPALTGASGLKKVFKRKYGVGSDSEGEGEVEVDESRHVGEGPDDLPDKVKLKIQDGSQTEAWKESGTSDTPSGLLSPWNPHKEGQTLYSPGNEADLVISRETDPPPHARLEFEERNRPKNTRDSQDGSNPWA